MAFELPALNYSYDSLEPYIDARTMEIHHQKHHGGYVKKLNNAIEGTAAENKSLEAILAEVSKYAVAVRNNGGGTYNHNLYWEIMSPEGGGEPGGELTEAIKKEFGSFADFRDAFTKAALGRFGSGWAWLIKQNSRLKITSIPNQDNPLMDVTEEKGTPILGIDVWEHAYYLKYQNRRADYVEAFWNVINWKEVERRYKQ